MNSSSQIVADDMNTGLAYVYKSRSVMDDIFSSFADYIIGIKEVTSLMFYTIDDNNNELKLIEHRNMHQDFPRNFSRIEKTNCLARSIINSKKTMEVIDKKFSVVSNKFGINIKKGFIGIPIRDKMDGSSASKGAILLWTSFIGNFSQKNYEFIKSMADYLSKSIEWNAKFEQYNMEFE